MTLSARNIRLLMELRRYNLPDALLAAMERTPRERFVPAMFADQAYENMALPLPNGQTISQPVVVAQMLQALALEPHHKVLEIGTGSGYQTAILAQLARRVYSLDIQRSFIVEAQPLFLEMGLLNITAMAGDGRKGWRLAAPFDRIIIAAAAAEPPIALLEQLREGGKMVLPLGQGAPEQPLVCITRTGNHFTQQAFGTARFVPLHSGAPCKASPPAEEALLA